MNTHIANQFALANILEHYLLGDNDFHQGQLEDLERFYEDMMSDAEANWYDDGYLEYLRKECITDFLQYNECVEAINVLEQISDTFSNNAPVEYKRMKYLLNLSNIKY